MGKNFSLSLYSNEHGIPAEFFRAVHANISLILAGILKLKRRALSIIYTYDLITSLIFARVFLTDMRGSGVCNLARCVYNTRRNCHTINNPFQPHLRI